MKSGKETLHLSQAFLPSRDKGVSRMKKTGIITGSLVFAVLIISSFAISSVPQKSKGTIFPVKQVASFHVHVKKTKNLVTYQLWENPRSNQDTLIRKEKGIAHKSILVPKTLSSKIKSDLLVLAWKSQYSQYRYTLDVNGPCTDNLQILVGSAEPVKVCPYQKQSFTKGLHIEKNLSVLFENNNAHKKPSSNKP